MYILNKKDHSIIRFTLRLYVQRVAEERRDEHWATIRVDMDLATLLELYEADRTLAPTFRLFCIDFIHSGINAELIRLVASENYEENDDFSMEHWKVSPIFNINTLSS